MVRSVRIAALLLACASVWPSPSPAAETAERGRQLLERHCGACHATGPSDPSPRPGAPPFRSIGTRMDLDVLADRMADLLVSPHAEMPSFRFSRRDARAIRVYLNAIQR